MIIKLCPYRGDLDIVVKRKGDILEIEGVEYDFSPLPEGAVLPECSIDSIHITGETSRKDGHVLVTLRIPHGANAPEERRFPIPLFDPDDGILILPDYDIVQVEHHTEEDFVND